MATTADARSKATTADARSKATTADARSKATTADARSKATYAIVKTGGKQYKVAAGDVVKVEKLDAEPGAKVSLPVALVVDGSDVTTDPAKLAKVSVTAEIVEHTKGPKIRIHKFKNKTGYHKRQGHRQRLTVLKVTGIK